MVVCSDSKQAVGGVALLQRAVHAAGMPGGLLPAWRTVLCLSCQPA